MPHVGDPAPALVTNVFVTVLAIDQGAEIRHVLVDDSDQVIFDGYSTGGYHGTMAVSGDWTILAGSIAVLGIHPGKDWSTLANDVDDHVLNSASRDGA